ncbi:aminoacyl-tRNA deacylase [Tuanshanicoccus lijuaniae]|uniref:aminoacyl-tRNA deacylase n=1 Tax=Aerococcaceae bacterium zg-1292 TaxID=2774330 RepID=UPI001BD90A2A|nr:aminoacyl-tRNA deacylase [Aerococcaceae bacterium zg-BR9]MBF6978365.1 aminoacyl-tRNA deacylase [Aerococcaceae bacterium zg-BR22]MBS4457040.1 aminoacyl-tRNA deacylase [Aerococcaceae bacterium zg-A91]MBS4458885.1 aminoacyl-tRNA deacylase [Aerococcaceae bacterium zg-BR33]
MAKQTKTNVMRWLETAGIVYQEHQQLNGKSPNGSPIYKTLVTIGKSKAHYVFVIPIDRSLDLKKAAKAVGEKSIEMIKEKELLPLTGYVHGGCSPIGMKKQFQTVFDASAQETQRLIFSAGKVGVSVELDVHTFAEHFPLVFADVATAE